MDSFPAPIPVACGLAFDVEKAPTKSGFKPAQFDLGAGKDLFADLRLEGFAALMRLGFARELIIFGGNEGRYKDEKPVINRAWAIAEMLKHDFGIPSERVRHVASNSNTGGNVEAIRRTIGKQRGAVISNHYHLPRASTDLASASLRLPLYPAEAFWLLEDRTRKGLLIERLGGNAYAERTVEEVQGIADKLVGAYQPRTDAAPAPTGWLQRVFGR